MIFPGIYVSNSFTVRHLDLLASYGPLVTNFHSYVLLGALLEPSPPSSLMSGEGGETLNTPLWSILATHA
jgi:hypothetical protein